MTKPHDFDDDFEWTESRTPRHAAPRYDTGFTSTAPDMPLGLRRELPSARELGLSRRPKFGPSDGWRRALHRATGGNVVPTATEYAPRLPGRGKNSICSIAVLSLKGGVGKTTTTVGLGATIATMRGDRVIAVDANPDFGTLAQRGPDQSASTVRDLLADETITRYSDVRRHTSQGESRLEFLGSARDPAVSEAFSEADYRRVHQILDRFYNVVLADCGTGLTHSALQGVLNTATNLIVVASPAIDSARSALATLDWLDHHGYHHLVPAATVVVNSSWTGRSGVDVNRLTNYFQNRIRRVFVIPFDDHLTEGGEISLERMNRKTREAYMEIATAIPALITEPGQG